jgi:hypothetical protein
MRIINNNLKLKVHLKENCGNDFLGNNFLFNIPKSVL